MSKAQNSVETYQAAALAVWKAFEKSAKEEESFLGENND